VCRSSDEPGEERPAPQIDELEPGRHRQAVLHGPDATDEHGEEGPMEADHAQWWPIRQGPWPIDLR